MMIKHLTRLSAIERNCRDSVVASSLIHIPKEERKEHEIVWREEEEVA